MCGMITISPRTTSGSSRSKGSTAFFCFASRSMDVSTFWLICIPHFSDARRLDFSLKGGSITLLIPRSVLDYMVPHVLQLEDEHRVKSGCACTSILYNDRSGDLVR